MYADANKTAKSRAMKDPYKRVNRSGKVVDTASGRESNCQRCLRTPLSETIFSFQFWAPLLLSVLIFAVVYLFLERERLLSASGVPAPTPAPNCETTTELTSAGPSSGTTQLTHD